VDFVKGLQATNHVVLFYNDLKACRQVLFTYLKAGMDKGEVGFYVTGGERAEQIQKATEEEFSINIKRYEMVGALKIVNYNELYIIDEKVNIPKIMELWQKVVDEAKERGFKGVRACGEMSCFFRHNLTNELLEYEKACNRRLKMPMTAVCAYDVNLLMPFGEKFFLDLLKAHSHFLFTEPEIGFNATLEAVERGLERALGSLSKEMIFATIKNHFGLEKEDIPKRFMDFHEALEKTFSIMTAGLLESMVFRDLYSKLKTAEGMPATLGS